MPVFNFNIKPVSINFNRKFFLFIIRFYDLNPIGFAVLNDMIRIVTVSNDILLKALPVHLARLFGLPV